MNDLINPTNGFDQLFLLSEKLSKSTLIPNALKGKPGDLAVILLYGQELGLPPMTSLSFIHCVEGKPELSGAGKIALIRRKFPDAVIKISYENDTATCSMARNKTDEPVVVTFNAEDAKVAGLHTRATHQKFPKDMRIWRAVSKCARLVFPDLVLNLYTEDEIEDISDNSIHHHTPNKHLGSKYEPIDIPKVELVHKNKHWNIPNQEVIHNTNQEPKEETKCLDPLPVRQEMSNSGEGKYPIWGWGKWKGKAINEVPLDELSSYIVFLGTKNFDFKKPANKDFFEHVARYLGSNYFMAQQNEATHICFNCNEMVPNSARECPNCGMNEGDEPTITVDTIPF